LLVCCARRVACEGCDDVAVQLQDMHQLTKDLVDEMKELIEAVSAFSGLAATYDDADLKILVTTHEYRHVIHLTRLMSETVKQWRALAQTVGQYAYRPSPRIIIPKLGISLLRACFVCSLPSVTLVYSLAPAIPLSRLCRIMGEEMPQCKAALIFSRQYKSEVIFPRGP
jgi:hypothetical protein